MTAELTPAGILASIPGWEDATWEELSGGLTNETYLVKAGDKTGVLKIDDQQRVEPFNTRGAEAAVQITAAAAGLAPGVVRSEDRYYFSEFVAGTVWTRSHLDSDENLDLLAAALKRLHALPLSGRSFDARVAARRYVAQIRSLDNAIIDRCSTIIESMCLPQNLCCCHNDLVVENLLTTPALMFLDWEYACDNDPFFDLATVIEHHELSDARATRLLDAYFDGDGQRWTANLEQQRRLYLALLCLWMAARPDTATTELDRVVDRLVTSCS